MLHSYLRYKVPGSELRIKVHRLLKYVGTTVTLALNCKTHGDKLLVTLYLLPYLYMYHRFKFFNLYVVKKPLHNFLKHFDVKVTQKSKDTMIQFF